MQPDRLKELAHKIFEYQSKKPKEDLEIKELRRRLNMNKKSTSNIVLAIENGNNPKVLLERLEQLEDERVAIEYEINKKQQRATQLSENEILSLLGRFITERDKREIINNFVTAVYLYDSEFKIFYSLNGGEQKFNLGELRSTNTLPSRTPNTTIVVGKQGILLTAKKEGLLNYLADPLFRRFADFAVISIYFKNREFRQSLPSLNCLNSQIRNS